jgi:potassium efflux system protein
VQKRDTLAELRAQYSAAAARLTQLDQAQLGLVAQAREFVEFIEGELMTIPSQPPLHRVSAAQLSAVVATLFDAKLWRELAADTWTALSGSVDLVILVLLAATLLAASRRWARREIRRIAPLTRKIRSDSMSLTFVVLGCTVLLSSLLPLILCGFGWIIQRASLSDLSSSLGGALFRAGLWVFVLGFVRQMVKPDGLAPRHFRWTDDTCGRIGRNLLWLLGVLPVLVAISRFTFFAGIPGWNLFSRITFLSALALLFLFLWRVLRRGRPQQRIADALTEMSDPLAHARSRWLIPIGLLIFADGLLSYLGYHYTAMNLDAHFGWTIVLLIALFVGQNLMVRWSTLVQRRMRFNELVKRREELRAARGEGEATEATEFTAVEERELDVVGLGEQTRRVVSAALVFFGVFGFYLIWGDLFPALRVLDAVQLPFSHLAVQDGVETRVPVTLTDLGVAALVFMATFIGARNLPGLLEFVLLQRLPIDAGARYAIITIARYLIVAVGVVVGFGIIGADWSKLQWLVAALGVGLGFGLQEIVANFISGIILLFERPIRVGDVITLGDTDGVVTKIRIRATTIRNWDQHELIVPNKEFITGRLLNWTLSDPVNRVVIRVGVAYGSDTDKALAIMLDTATQHPEVLGEPKPVVVFEGFGESSLDLSLRFYLSGLEARLQTMSELHGEINRRFNEAGIEIPFAQRDLHLRSGEPLEVVMRPGGRSPQPS